jgi:hypothetical protein
MRQQHLFKDTIQIMPASLLAFKQQWQAIFDRLPEGACLIVLPGEGSKIRDQLLGLARAFEDKGRDVRIKVVRQEPPNNPGHKENVG